MKDKCLLIVVLIQIVSFCYAQYGYRVGDQFITLTPSNASVYYARIEKSNNDIVEKLVAGQNLYRSKLHAISDTSYLLDKKLQNKIDVSYESEIFTTLHGFTAIVLPKIIVSVDSDDIIKKLLNQYSGILEYSNNDDFIYTLKCNLRTSTEILELVQSLDKIDGIRWCKPGMLSEVRFNSNEDNDFFTLQYYLHNTKALGGTENYSTNVVKAWDVVSGSSNIKVAVVDQGVERNHEDLAGAVLDGYTCTMPSEKGDPINDVSFESKGHGTACAGIIGAIDNHVGIKGVASGVKILPINISPYTPIEIIYYNEIVVCGLFCEPEYIALGIKWAVNNGADVISCSWTSENDTNITAAINYARTNGRNGKGCVIVASSGNRKDTESSDAGYPANLTGVMCVGAIKRDGTIWGYSKRGTWMDLVAPSGDGLSNTNDIVTTDRMGEKGYNNSSLWASDVVLTNYTQRFSGTSAACPQVAGIAALVLSVNPNLSESEVRTILNTTATDLGATGKDNTFGYGLVNAYAAVTVASYWQACHNCTLYGNSTLCNSSTYTLSNVPSGVSVSWRFEGLTASSPNIYPNSSNNTCLVSLGNNSFKGNLCADIMVQGYVVATYKKQIEGGNGFIGYYWDDIEAMDVLWSDDNWVYPGHSITVRSNDLAGKTVKTSVSSSPSTYTILNNSNNAVVFTMPYLSTGEYLTLWVTGVCGTQTFKFYARTTTNSNNLLKVIALDETHYLLSAEQLDNKSDANTEKMSNTKKTDDWVFRIYNAINLQLITAQLVEEDNYILDTTSWQPGVYIIRAYIKGKPYTSKFVVK